MPLPRRSPPTAPGVLARLGGLLAPQGWTPSASAALPGQVPEDDVTPGGVPRTVAIPRAEPERWATARGRAGDGSGAADGSADPDAEEELVVPGPRAGAESGRVSLPSSSGGDAPAGWRGGRFDPGRRGAAALAVLALVAGLLAAAVVLRARPRAVLAPPVVAAGQPVPGSVSASTPPSAVLVVAVDGKVVHPGLVRLPVGSRVDDGIRAAGGVLPGTDLAGLNLARKLTDGEQVVVGAPPPVAGPVGGPAAGRPGGLVDLNAATAADLDGLPGIGPVLAQHIVDWRTEHGPFGSVDQLREVSGIGESKYAQLKSKVRV